MMNNASRKSGSNMIDVNGAVLYPSTENIETESSRDNHNQNAKASPYHFLFEGTDSGKLKCTIFSKNDASLKRTLINGIVDFLEIHNLSSENGSIMLAIEKNKLEITFISNITQDLIESMLKFINFLSLSELGFLEAYQNPFSLWFYASNGGEQILNFKNYPSALRIFLDQEKSLVDRILKRSDGKYSTLVEVGCGEIENIDLAKSNNLRYHGIDFSASWIISAQKRIKKEDIKNTTVECLNIVSFEKDDVFNKLNGRPVFLFPFNLLGNIAPISKLIARFKKLGLDIIFSVYKTNDEINNIRLQYYSNCGYKHIEKTENPHGVIFSSDEGLYTIAYKKEYLENLIKSFGFNVLMLETVYGVIIYASIISPHVEPMPLKGRISDELVEENVARPVSPTGEELYALGQKALDNKNNESAYQFFEHACEKKFVKAFASLGLFKIDPMDRHHDKKAGIAYLEYAADAGYARAMFNLGRLYEKGDTEDGSIDYHKALGWYEKADARESTEMSRKKIELMKQTIELNSSYAYTSGANYSK